MAQLTRKDKVQLTTDLVNQLHAAKVLYLTDFTGLSVQNMTELRRRFRDAHIRYIVVKNRLALRALEQLEFPDISPYLRGPTGLVVGQEDPVVPAKTLREFARDHDERPAVKVGIVENRLVSAQEIMELADLPSREALLAGIAGSLTGAVSGVVGVLDTLVREITSLVNEVAKKQAEGGG